MWGLAAKGSQGPSAALTGYVGRDMGRVEALLKVVGSRPENLVDNFFTLLPSGSAADFQRIIDIKVWLPNAASLGFPCLSI